MSDDLLPRVVLNRPLYGGNVGSSARAMANMGLVDLHVVQPQYKDETELRKMAVHSGASIRESITRHEELGTAVAGCTVVIACTARPRRWKAWELVSPTEAGELLAQCGADGEQTALLFGTEDSGLAQEDLAWATHLCHIPTSIEASSLNLSQAVLLLGWEWGKARGRLRRLPHRNKRRRPAAIEQVQGATEQAAELLDVIDFWRGKSREQGMATLRQALIRGAMSDVEVHYIRGVVNKLRWFVDNGPRLDERQARDESGEQPS